MSLKLGFPFNYDSYQRQSEISRRMDEVFKTDNCFKVMSEESVHTPSKNADQWTKKLDLISKEVNDLNSNINQINCDGTEDKFLQYNDKCLKLLEQMDRMGDLKEHLSAKSKRKVLIDTIKGFETQLRQSSLENLEQLLKRVKDMDQRQRFQDLYKKVDPFLQNESKTATINALEDFRYQLEGVYQKLKKKSSDV